eukprot:gb/GECH01009500.1/.p1 GENE.gb/GECH01009500.1/~~gb/GECH01009500.1/.p1  ORF type:complete len:146 (+),score=7.89 gb/GECH01009500.1/:1-438(+)
MEEENHDQSNGDNNKHTPNTSSTPFEDRHMDILYSQNQSLKEQLFDECRYLMREVRDLREELSLRESNETELVKMNKLYKKTISNLLQQFKGIVFFVFSSFPVLVFTHNPCLINLISHSTATAPGQSSPSPPFPSSVAWSISSIR